MIRNKQVVYQFLFCRNFFQQCGFCFCLRLEWSIIWLLSIFLLYLFFFYLALKSQFHWFIHDMWLPYIFLYPPGWIYIRQHGRRFAYLSRHFFLKKRKNLEPCSESSSDIWSYCLWNHGLIRVVALWNHLVVSGAEYHCWV